ncbi:MAG: phosphoribosylaminoimidazolesuccinocarboxamide synthase [Micavibrio aeruginosavorus]|uniref:Phosphoribosylaminoimidazole-succinocarboxamide synthase n=1 Tax=Micavibrio aeruginosavorus TaxID=349221 RepID=A0A2W5MVC4_9BACT|nr:MAG: phosphoribosylaminoimidazolesuccinocarboxamide synthase [Micavibrio aeruginosavorus]
MNVFADASKLPLPNHYPGKVRDVYDLEDGRLLMATSDRLSAFNRSITAVPHKGAILNAITKFWFDRTNDIAPNPVLDYPDPNVMVVKKLDMLPIEVIVRSYMTGSTSTSIWTMYKNGKRSMYGHDFPEGMVKNQKLEKNIVTPTQKNKDDDPITPDEIVSMGLVPKDLWEQTEKTALALFAHGQKLAAAQGLILVDTKYEFGLDKNGVLHIADEIHTPDSSRYWVAESYDARFAAGQDPEGLDKEFVRLWLTDHMEDPYTSAVPHISDDDLEMFSGKYRALYKKITGEDFKPSSSDIPVEQRVLNNIQPYIPS